MTENGIKSGFAYYMKLERLASVAVKSIVFGSVAPCCLVDIYLYFGGKFCLYLQGGIV